MQIYPNQFSQDITKALRPCYLVFGDEPQQKFDVIEQIRAKAKANGFEERTVLVAETGFNWNLDHLEFEHELWPLMASRSKAFEAIKYKGGWVGHYDQNLMDGNPILGHWSGGLSNFIVAAGFSGHGLQHAPAVSLGLSELILQGGFRTFDLIL